jgi:antitoxin ParD1/3/4
MPASLHVSLPDDMRAFVDHRASGKSAFATPSEYVRDLIRRDMALEAERSFVHGELMKSIADIKAGRLISGDELRARSKAHLTKRVAELKA